MTNYEKDSEKELNSVNCYRQVETIQRVNEKSEENNMKNNQDNNNNKNAEQFKIPLGGGRQKKEEEEEEDKREEELTKPPDGGWGWMVVIGCFLITSLLPMVSPCFGILFSRYLLDLGTSSTMTAWIFNCHCFIWNIMGLISRSLTQEFGWRTVGVLGSFLTSISLAISALSPNAEFLFFSFSMMCALGGGTVVSICFIILPHYFDHHRGVANGIMMAGICLGQILAPPLVQYLQAEYGFVGATLIIGAIMLNACVGASFFHPVEWHNKHTDKRKKRDIPVAVQEGRSPLLARKEEALGKPLSVKSFGKETGEKEVDWVEIIMHKRNLPLRGSRHMIAVSQLSLSSSLAASTLDITNMGAGYVDYDTKGPSGDQNRSGRKSILEILKRVANSTLSDLRVLRSPRALIISLGATCCINGYINFIMMVPFAMQVAGHSLESSAYCVSASAICNLLMRMMVSSMSDWPRFSVRVCYVTGLIIILISTTVFPFLTDFRMMIACMAIWGCGVGTNMGVYNLVMIAVMGLENLAPVFGACCFMVALGFITFGPIIGVIRDATDSYYASMWFVSAMLCTSIILWLFMPAAEAHGKKKIEEEQLQDEKQIVDYGTKV